jgi:hypothetical protein
MHPDFFIPLNLALPASVKSFFQEVYVDELRGKQSQRRQLGLFPLPDSTQAVELKTLVDDFLQPIGLRSGAFGAFVLNPLVKDNNIHVDAMRLNTRLSFYELAETPGSINWYADDGTGYEDWRPSYLGGRPILDYRYPWVDELQAGKRTWAQCPEPVYSVTTNVPSALIMTALPHNVVQGPGFRITVSCQVVDSETGSVEHTWAKVRSYFNSTVSPASAS